MCGGKNDEVCSHLSDALYLISSGRDFNIVDVLNCIEKSLQKLNDNESDEDEDYDYDEDLDYYADGDEDAMRIELPVIRNDDETTILCRLIADMIADMNAIKSPEGKLGVEEDHSADESELAGNGDGYIHIRIHRRSDRKTVTTVQGISEDYDLTKIVRACKKEFACNGAVVENPWFGRLLIQLQGDQRKHVKDFLLKNKLATAERLEVHGF